MLERIGFEVFQRQGLVRNDIVGEFDHFDIKSAFGGHFFYDIDNLGVRAGRDANPNGLGLRRAR